MSHKKRHDAASIRPRRSRWDVGQVISTKRNRRDRSDPRVASREEGLEVVGVERGSHHILEDVEEELVAHAVDRALDSHPAGGASAARLSRWVAPRARGPAERRGRPSARSSTSRAPRRLRGAPLLLVGVRRDRRALVGGVIVADGEGETGGRRRPRRRRQRGSAGRGARRRPFRGRRRRRRGGGGEGGVGGRAAAAAERGVRGGEGDHICGVHPPASAAGRRPRSSRGAGAEELRARRQVGRRRRGRPRPRSSPAPSAPPRSACAAAVHASASAARAARRRWARAPPSARAPRRREGGRPRTRRRRGAGAASRPRAPSRTTSRGRPAPPRTAARGSTSSTGTARPTGSSSRWGGCGGRRGA